MYVIQNEKHLLIKCTFLFVFKLKTMLTESTQKRSTING